MKSISAGEANRHFSSLLRDVTAGATITVLSRGKPVATLAPIQTNDPERENARQVLLERLRQQTPVGQRAWTRDELYDD